MADKKISALTPVTTPLAGTEVLPIVQSSSTKNVTVDNLTKGRTVNATTFDTDVAAAGVTLTGTTLAADGTDTNIDISITPKGTGGVNLTKLVVNGTVDGTNQSFSSATDNNNLKLSAANNFGSNNSVQDKWSIRWRGRPASGNADTAAHHWGLYDEIAAAYRLVVAYNGNFGFGTTAPAEQVDISRAGSTGQAKMVLTGGDGEVTESKLELYATGVAGTAADRAVINASSDVNAVLSLRVGGVEELKLNSSGATVGNLNLDGNTIISTNTNGNIALTPNGTGEVDIPKVDIDGGTIDAVTAGAASPLIKVVAKDIRGTSYPMTSSSGTVAIADTGIYGNTADVGFGQFAVYDLHLTGSVNPGGSSLYHPGNVGIVMVGTAYSGALGVKSQIFYTELMNPNFQDIGEFTVTATFWDGTTEATDFSYGNTYQIRIKVDGWNASYVGSGMVLLLTRRITA
jgi:hypothetical protein